MRLHRLPFLMILLCLMILNACEYKPKGDYFRDLKAQPPANVSITIPGHSDTLVATFTQNYYVQVSCEDRTVLFYRLYIEGVEQTLQSAGGNTFFIDPLAFINKDGIYRMTLETGINTGSGSIGDVLGTEGYLFSKDFLLVVLRQQSTFYPDLLINRSAGKMKVILDVPSDVQNIKKVTFSKSTAGSPFQVFATVAGSNHFEAYDPDYVGEYANYSVQTYLGDPTGTIFIPFVNGSSNVSSDLPEVNAGVSVHGFPLLRWDKTHYADNCGSYRVYAKADGSSSIMFMGAVTNINDTVYEATGIAFPGYYLFHIAPAPFQLPSWFTDETAWNYLSTEAATYIGMSSFWFSRFLTPNGSFIYYTNSSNEIFEYSVETNDITDMITTSDGWFYTIAVSPNGKYLLAANGASNFSYLLYDLTTNQSAWTPSSQVIGPGASTGIISIADNGVASIITGNKVVVYDFLNQSSVAQHTLPLNGDRTVISADGQYLFAEAGSLYLYKLVSGTLLQKWSSSGTSGTIKYYTFDPSQPAKAKIFIDQTFFTKNCDTWATEGNFTLDIDNICNIDFTNGHILGRTATDFKVFDQNSGSLQYQNPAGLTYTTYDLRIKKNTVFYSGGKKIIIF